MAEKKETTIPDTQQQRGSRMTNSPDLREEDIRALLEATRGSSSTTIAVASPVPAPVTVPAPAPAPPAPAEAPSTNDAAVNGGISAADAGSDNSNNKTNGTASAVTGAAQRVEKRSRDDTVKQSPQKRRKSSAAASKKAAAENDVRMADAPTQTTSDATTTTTTTTQPQQLSTSNDTAEPTPPNVQLPPTNDTQSQPTPAQPPHDQFAADAPGEPAVPESSGRPPGDTNANAIPEGKNGMMAWLAKQVKAFGEQNRQDGDTSPRDGDNPERVLEREKVREENRERKKRWRESNQARNKDNDLRCRVTKRANKLFGLGTSEKKSEWVAAEFEKRRKKREAKEASKRFDQNGNAIFSLNDGNNDGFDGDGDGNGSSGGGGGGFGGGAAGAAGQMLANALGVGEGATVDNLREALIGIGNSGGAGSGAGGSDGSFDLANLSELLTAMAEDENIMRALADLITSNLGAEGMAALTAGGGGGAENTTVEDHEVSQDVEPDVAQDVMQDVAAAIQQEAPQEESVEMQEAPELAVDTEDATISVEAFQEALAHIQQAGLLPMDENTVEDAEQQQQQEEQPVEEFEHDLPMDDGDGEREEEADYSMLEDPNLLAELDVSPEMIAALQAATAAIAEKGLDINDFAALTANFPIPAVTDGVAEEGEHGVILEGEEEPMVAEGDLEHAEDNLIQESTETTHELSNEQQVEDAAATEQEHLAEHVDEVAEVLEDGHHQFSVEEIFQQALALQLQPQQEEEQVDEEMEGEYDDGGQIDEEHDEEGENEGLAGLVAGLDLEALAGIDLSSMGQDQIQALLAAVRALTGANVGDEGDVDEEEQGEYTAAGEDSEEQQHHQLDAEHQEHMIPELPGDLELLDEQHAEAGDASLGDILNSTADEVASADPTQHIAQAFLQALVQQVITSQSTAAAAAATTPAASAASPSATKATKSSTASTSKSTTKQSKNKSSSSTACTTSVFPADPKKTPSKRGRPRLPSPPPVPILPPPNEFTFKPTKMIVGPLISVHGGGGGGGGIPRSSKIPDDAPIPPEVARLLKPPTFFPKPGVGNVVRSIIREKVTVEHDPRVKAMGFPPMLARLKPPTAV